MQDSMLQERLLGPTAGQNVSAMEGAEVPRQEDSELLTVDDMLVKYVGEFGRSQLVHFILVNLAWSLEAMFTMVMIFGDRVPDWKCVEESSWSNSTSKCVPTAHLCDLDPGTWEWAHGKGTSTVSQWNLVCGQVYKVGLAGSLFFVGALLGAGFWGNMSDSRLGRKGSLAMCCLATVCLGLLTAAVPNYWMYVLVRVGTGLCVSGIGLTAFVLASEIIGPNKRGTAGMSAFYFFSLGIMLLPLIDMLSRSWRELYLLTSLPGACYCIFVLPFVWESPRWYLVKGRTGEAMKVMRVFAQRNRKVIPESASLMIDFSSVTENAKEGALQATAIDNTPRSAEFAGTLLDVFKSAETRMRMIVMVCIYFFIGVCYYGLSLNVVNLGFNLRVSVFLNGLVEVPAYVLTALCMGKMGRRTVLMGAMVISGVCCLAGSYVFSRSPLKPNTENQINLLDFRQGGNGMAFLRLLCGIIGMFGSAGAYNMVYVYITELFPTVVRNAALGLATQAASIGSVVAPNVAVMGRRHPAVPFVVFGLMSLLGALCAIPLPETKNQALLETMEELENAQKEKAQKVQAINDFPGQLA